MSKPELLKPIVKISGYLFERCDLAVAAKFGSQRLLVGVGDIDSIKFATVPHCVFQFSIHCSIQFQADLMWCSVKDVPQYFDVKMSKQYEYRL